MATRRNPRALIPWLIAAVLVAVIVAGRLSPHPANFAPVAAVALFAGVYLRGRWALVVPLAGLIISDIIIGGYSPGGMAVVYGAFGLIGLLGWRIGRRKTPWKIFSGTLLGSLLFFLITNNVFLYAPTLYPHDFGGMIQSYAMGLPFFKWTLLGDLFYSGVLFGGYALAAHLAKLYQLRLTSAKIGQ
jgi:hypothetical protein